MSETEYSILRPNPEDFVFRFKGKAYPVLKGIFYCYSKKFALSSELQSQSEFEANFDVSEESFKEFINACQGKSFSISKETVFDLEFLGSFWGVSDLKAKVARLIKNDTTGKLRLDSTIYKVQHKLGSDSDDQTLINNIDTFIEDDRFAQFPIDALQRLLYNEKFASLDPEKKSAFLKKVLQVHGKDASSLYADLTKAPLEQEELENILREKLVLQPLPQNLARSTVQLSRENTALNQVNSDLNNALKLLIDQLGNKDDLDLNQVVENLQHASELGDKQADEALSKIYSLGIGVEKDEAKASEYEEKANDPNKSLKNVSDSAITDLLDNSNDVDFDLSPSIQLPKPTSPYDDFQYVTFSSPSSPVCERGSPRSHHKYPFGSKKDKPKPVGAQRRIPVSKPKNFLDQTVKTEKIPLPDDENKNEENAVKERSIELEANNDDQEPVLDQQRDEDDRKNDTDSDFIFESKSRENQMQSEDCTKFRRNNLLKKCDVNDDNIVSEPEGEKRKERLKQSINHDIYLSPKGTNVRRSSFSSDAKTHLPHGVSEEEKNDFNLNDDDGALCEKIDNIKQRADEGDPSAMFVLGVLYWGNGGDNSDTEIEAEETGVEVDSNFKPDPKEAIKYYEKAAEAGEKRSMFNLATIYDFYHGGAVEQDLPRAIDLYRRAAQAGEVCALNNLAVLYETGTGVEQDLEEAAKIYKEAADKGDSDAMLNLGMLYESGKGVGGVDVAKAAELYEKAANNNDTDAQVKLALLYESGQVPGKTVKDAVLLYQKAAECENADAQFNLATMYESGEGVEKDESKVVEWYSKSAENGNSDAQFNLAVLYQNGQFGLAEDCGKAYEYYERSAEAGNPTAFYNMAVMIYNGDIDESKENSLDFFLKAAKLGCPEAQFFTGQLYEHGEECEKDLVKAAELYRKAADNRIVPAQYNLGVLLASGEGGVEKNVDEAIKYFKMAAESGDTDAQYNIDFLTEQE